MNSKNLPRFNGEASLYKGRVGYRSVATQSYSSVEQIVISQIRAGGGFGAKTGCEENCDVTFNICMAGCPSAECNQFCVIENDNCHRSCDSRRRFTAELTPL